MVDRVNFRAFEPAPPGEVTLENERRFRAAVEGAFNRVDLSISQLSMNAGSGGAGFIDGGGAGTVYGGIDPIDGGSA
jgi:hypothetical protein